jgi:hypothetical protein
MRSLTLSWEHFQSLDPTPKLPRARYDPDEFRRAALQRLRPHLHDTLLDQLPPLKALHRLLDEMAVGSDTRWGDQGGDCTARSARLILEQVPGMRKAIAHARDWGALAQAARGRWFGSGARELARERAERMLKSFEFLCSLEPDGSRGASGAPPTVTAAATKAPLAAADTADDGGASAAVHIECWRSVRKGLCERWSAFDLQIDASQPPEAVSVTGENGSKVRGSRQRLCVSAAQLRALPPDGKVGGGVAVEGVAVFTAEFALGPPSLPVSSRNSVFANRKLPTPSPMLLLSPDCGALPGAQGRGASAAAQHCGALPDRRPRGALAHRGAARHRWAGAAAAPHARRKGGCPESVAKPGSVPWAPRRTARGLLMTHPVARKPCSRQSATP